MTEIEQKALALSPDMKLTATGSFYPQSKIVFNSGTRPTMTLHADGRITLSDDAQPTEAAAACIEAMSDMIQNMIKNAVSRQPTQSDALQIAREALEGMVRYSGMRESWQDDNPQYVEAARDAIDVIDAALQEQSK